METGMRNKCGTCGFCVTDDGDPYCVMKDLYTTVNLDDDCDETDIRGEYNWIERKENNKQGGNMLKVNIDVKLLKKLLEENQVVESHGREVFIIEVGNVDFYIKDEKKEEFIPANELIID